MRFLLVILMSVSSSVFGATVVDNAIIEEISISKAYGNFAFIKLDKPVVQSGCATNGYWHFTLPLASDQDKAMYSSLLAAYTAGTAIRIDGFATAVCNELNTIESMASFTLKK